MRGREYHMEKIVLQAEPRRVGRHQLREMREANLVPAVVYGVKQEPQVVAVDAKALHKALHAAGTGLLSLQIASKAPIQVLPREVQRDPVKRSFLHVDFQVVSMTEKLRLHIPIEQGGTAPVLSNPDMVLVRRMDAVEVECLPGDIPPHLVADISKLETVDDELLVGDLLLPSRVRLMTDPTYVVFSVTMSRAAAEEEAEAAEVTAEEVEVVAKGKAARGEEFPES
jgi:large subunit ribosomal protein L25